MVISFRSRRLEREFNDAGELIRTYGPKQARIIQMRMTQLAASDNLDILRSLPQARAHELKGKLKGFISVDLLQPYRLLFLPDHDEIPYQPDGGLDWKKVTCIKIWEIRDTHE